MNREVAIVTAEPHLAASMSRVLLELGYRPTAVWDGEGGTVLVAVARPALVVVDARLPGGGGIDLCARVKEALGPATRVVVIGSAEAHHDVALDAGADGFLPVPVHRHAIVGACAPRLIACDLDGTLIAADDRLSVRVAAAVAAVIDAGIPIVAVTGRPWQWVLELAREHRLGPVAVVSNGAALLDVTSGAVEHNGLADGVVVGLMDRIRERVPGINFAIDATDALYAEPGFADPYYRGQHVVEDLVPLAERDVVKLVMRKDGLPSSELAAMLDEDVLAGVALPYAGFGEWVELLASGVSKASGLALVASRLGVDASEVWAIGDEWNDVPMFEWAGSAFAMGNAPAHVQAAAQRVLPAADDDGVAVLLDELTGS